MHRLIVRADAQYATLRALLESHPEVALAPQSPASGLLEWQGQSGPRRIVSDGTELIELADNNPLICAEEVAVPGPASTLALIALGPLVRAGLIAEPPVLQLSFEPEDSLAETLEALGCEETVVHVQALDLKGALAANGMAMIDNGALSDPDDLDAIYEEAFGRSFYVRRVESGEWDAQLVIGTPFAVYRLRLTPGERQSLLTVQVMADQNGKGGAAQIMHTFNVMAGFEECLGLPT